MWSAKARKILDKIEPVAETMGLKIIELDLPNGQNGIFRVYVDTLDAKKKVTVENCSKLSPIISDYLDAMDIFSFRYYLEVSSPGLDRPIRRWEELSSFTGKKMMVKLFEKQKGRKKFTGILQSVDEEKLEIILNCDGEEFTIEKDLIRKINIIWEGDL